MALLNLKNSVHCSLGRVDFVICLLRIAFCSGMKHVTLQYQVSIFKVFFFLFFFLLGFFFAKVKVL